MGDLSKKLQDMGAGKDFATAVGFAETIYSDVSLAYAAYSAGEKVLTYLGVLGTAEDPFAKVNQQLTIIQQKLDQVLLALEKLKKEVAAASNLFTRTEIANEAADAAAAAYNAKAYLEHPDDSQIATDFDHARQTSYIAVNRLYSNEYYWKRLFLPEALYDDVWSGVVYPDGVSQAGTSDDCIWDYRMALVSYLEAIIARSIVLLAASADEKSAHWNEMLGYAENLCERYRTILNTFRTIRPPTHDEMINLIPAVNDANFYKLDLDGATHWPLSAAERDEILRNWVPGGRWRLAGYLTGVVEAWTGYACLVAYPTQDLTAGGAYLALSGSFWSSGSTMAAASVSVTNKQAFDIFYDRFTLRHYLRTKVQIGRIFDELGLPHVLACIRYLYATLGTAPSQYLPDYSVRSMREVFDSIPASLKPMAMKDGAASLRGMADAIGVSGALAARSIFLMDEALPAP